MNRQRLLEKMSAEKVSVGQMCKLLNMSRSAFYRKTRGISEFTLGECERIVEILKIESPVEISFDKKVS